MSLCAPRRSLVSGYTATPEIWLRSRQALAFSGSLSQTATSLQLANRGIMRTCHSTTTPVPTTAAFHWRDMLFCCSEKKDKRAPRRCKGLFTARVKGGQEVMDRLGEPRAKESMSQSNLAWRGGGNFFLRFPR